MTTQGHVLITGVIGRIGTAIAQAFLRAGYRITGIDFRADELAATVAALGPPDRVRGRIADLSDAARVETTFEEAWADPGPVDVLVNCAAIAPVNPVAGMDPCIWDRVMAVNLRAPVILTSALAKRVLAAGRTASIVNISSGNALRARAGAAHYCASKAAVESLTRSAALELGPSIRVNAVSPGFVDVDSPVNPVSREYADSFPLTPMGRHGTPEDIARAVFWLAGRDAEFCTGTVLRVDGGSLAGLKSLPVQSRHDGGTPS
jgi:NAD(P)-dependent dehydrogenase (short-subunit alcohol dehydrogenase family)